MAQDRKYWMTQILAGPAQGDGQERWERKKGEKIDKDGDGFVTFRIIYDKIDKDGDGFVTFRIIYDKIDKDGNGFVTFRIIYDKIDKDGDGFVTFRIIYDKIDKDGDGFVTEEELMNWVKHVQNRYIVTDTEKQWKDHEIEGDKLGWASYKTRTYGQQGSSHFNFVYFTCFSPTICQLIWPFFITKYQKMMVYLKRLHQ